MLQSPPHRAPPHAVCRSRVNFQNPSPQTLKPVQFSEAWLTEARSAPPNEPAQSHPRRRITQHGNPELNGPIDTPACARYTNTVLNCISRYPRVPHKLSKTMERRGPRLNRRAAGSLCLLRFYHFGSCCCDRLLNHFPGMPLPSQPQALASFHPEWLFENLRPVTTFFCSRPYISPSGNPGSSLWPVHPRHVLSHPPCL